MAKKREPQLQELEDLDHEEILDNPEADAYLSRIAIESAVRRGMTLKAATAVFGIEPVDEDAEDLDVEDLNRLLADVLAGRKASIPGAAAQEKFEEIAADVRANPGLIPNVTTESPDPDTPT